MSEKNWKIGDVAICIVENGLCDGILGKEYKVVGISNRFPGDLIFSIHPFERNPYGISVCSKKERFKKKSQQLLLFEDE